MTNVGKKMLCMTKIHKAFITIGRVISPDTITTNDEKESPLDNFVLRADTHG
jgi:hypothetical protein